MIPESRVSALNRKELISDLERFTIPCCHSEEPQGEIPTPREPAETVPNWRSKHRCQQRGELRAYTFAGGFCAGLRGRGIHLARGTGLAAWLILTPDKSQRTARRRRADGLTAANTTSRRPLYIALLELEPQGEKVQLAAGSREKGWRHPRQRQSRNGAGRLTRRRSPSRLRLRRRGSTRGRQVEP